MKQCAGSTKPQLPCETRWNSQLDCVSSYLKNRVSLLEIIDVHEEDIAVSIVRIVNNIAIYKEAKHLFKQLTPIAKALDFLQGDKSYIFDTVRLWIKLIENEDLRPYHDILFKRMNQSITPAHLVAYLLHPKFKGEGLTEIQKEDARSWLHEINPEFLNYVVSFKAQGAPFPKSYFTQTLEELNPSSYWRSLDDVLDKDFVDLISHLMFCPSSSASME